MLLKKSVVDCSDSCSKNVSDFKMMNREEVRSSNEL